MDDLREQVELLENSANLSTSIDDIQKAIDQLTAARAKIAAGACLFHGPHWDVTDHDAIRSEDGALNPRKAAGPLQEIAGDRPEGPEARICGT